MTAEQKREQKILQYLDEALGMEHGLTRALQSQIAIAPRGRYRSLLETHLRETRGHADRVQQRIRELQDGRANPLEAGTRLAQSAVAQLLAVGRFPVDLARGTSGEERVLKNAKDAIRNEALEIATYTALELLADRVGDERTAGLARDILVDERRMLDRVLEELPRLTGDVVEAHVGGRGSYDVSTTGAADAVRAIRTPAPSSAEDLPLRGYDELSAETIIAKLPELSQPELGVIERYERSRRDRATVRDRIAALREDEPWRGYDEMTAAEIRSALSDADGETREAVRRYERSHKDRATVLDAARRETAGAR